MPISLVVGAFTVTSNIRDQSVTMKLNTLDFALDDPPAIAKGDLVTFSDSANEITWTGTVVSIEKRPQVRRVSGHSVVAYTAVNSDVADATMALFDLSDAPANNTTLFLKEDGSGHIILEDGLGSYLTEGAYSFKDWQDFATRDQTNLDASVSTYGQVTVYRPGLKAGRTLRVTSADLSVDAFYTIQVVTVRWPTNKAGAPMPVYALELGPSGVPPPQSRPTRGLAW